MKSVVRARRAHGAQRPPGMADPGSVSRVACRLLRTAFVLLAALGLALLPGEAAAQTGVVAGQVLDATSSRPMAGAQVVVDGTQLGGLTDSGGRFRIEGIPEGEVTLRVVMIGYRPFTQVTSTGTLDLRLRVTESAIELDQIVVTGTPGGTRQRAIGNVVARVDAAEITEVAPIITMQDLLTSREAGVAFQRSSGNVGTGAGIRVRGFSSLGVGNQPLIYVDGIRVDNNSTAGPNLRDGAQVSKLDDINPNDIESIEIIKGPAAATLYGTEASNGVIQIITKRGTTGAPQFDLTINQGANFLMNPSEKVGMSYKRIDGEIVGFNIWEQEKAAGRPFFSTGYSQGYALSMRGGTDVVRYYLSADWDDNTGIVDYNTHTATNLRANVSVVPSESFNVDVSMGYIDGFTSFMQQKTNWGVWEQAQWANPLGRDTRLRGFLRARPEEIANVEATRDNSRFTGSMTLNHNPFDWFSQRLVFGIDVAREENRVLFPRHPDGSTHDFGGLSLGSIEIDRPYTQFNTFDYAASLRWSLLEGMSMTSSAGVQYYSKRLNTVFSEGRVFPAPAIRNLSGAAVTTATEQFVENKTLGGYLQQEIGFNDRIFLTAAVRGDDNSAFGTNFDAAIYPKFSATWVVTEEPWFNMEWMNSLRLRSAWGKAGQQPDAFAAVRLYSPAVGPDDESVVTPAEVGNPDLGPEVSTELEVGFDAAFLDDRLSTTVTYYTQKVNDALVALPVPPSRGFPGSQFVNVGQVSNWGWEINTDARILERDRFSFDLTLGLAYNRNRVDDLGGRPPTTTIQEGFPFPGYFAQKVVSADLDPATGRATNILCDGGQGTQGLELGGPAVPCAQAPRVFWGSISYPWETSVATTFTFFENLRFFANMDIRTGAIARSTDVSCRHTCFTTSLASQERNDPIFLAYADGRVPGGPLGLYDSGFAKLREVSLSYTLPESWAGRIGASRASFTAAGRNLWTAWVAQPDVFGAPVHDPEARRAGDLANVDSNSNVPPTSSFAFTMRVSF